MPAHAQLPFQPFGRLLNISTRGHVGTGDDALIAGFVIVGGSAKKLIIRGLGPSLSESGVFNPLPHPVIELHNSAGAVVASNTGWRQSDSDAIQATGLAPTDDRDAALIKTLAPGAYTVVLRGAGDSTGTALVELYDLDGASGSLLANVSTRGFVNETDPLIGGVIIADEGVPMNRIVARALGPSLKSAGVTKALNDPALEFRRGDRTLVSENDDSENAEHLDVLEQNGLLPPDGGESAVASVAGPGAYTAVVRTADGGSGIALVELYQLR